MTSGRPSKEFDWATELERLVLDGGVIDAPIDPNDPQSVSARIATNEHIYLALGEVELALRLSASGSRLKAIHSSIAARSRITGEVL